MSHMIGREERDAAYWQSVDRQTLTLAAYERALIDLGQNPKAIADGALAQADTPNADGQA